MCNGCSAIFAVQLALCICAMCGKGKKRGLQTHICRQTVDLDLSEKDQVFIVETKPSFVAVVYPKTNRCDSKGVQARPGVIQKTPRMSKHRCHTCKGREGCYHLVIFNLAKHEDTKVKNLERNLSL